jgi:hypothetical protein
VAAEFERDFVTVKYGEGGDKLWEARYGSRVSGRERSRDAVADAHGNVVVMGKFSFEPLVAKYNAAGTEEWLHLGSSVALKKPIGSFSSTLGLHEPNAVALDTQSNVYVTGGAGLGHHGEGDYGTVTYSSDGEELWAVLHKDAGEALALAVDVNGNVHVTGAGPDGPTTVKYDSAGNEIWARSRPEFSSWWGLAIATDSSSNVYVTGSTFASYATAKYSSNGDLLWVGNHREPGGNVWHLAYSLAVDQDREHRRGRNCDSRP